MSLDLRPIMVAVSGWGMADDRKRTKDAGFDHHLVKPVAPKALNELLETLSTASRGQQSA